MVKIELKQSELNILGRKFLEIDKDYTINKGLYRLIGPNGSGKTLFLEYLSGLRKSENMDSDIQPNKVLYLGEVGIGIEDLTILENIKLTYWIFGTALDNDHLKKIKELYSEDQLNKIYSQASFGMQLMVGLSLLFAEIDWELIILDETLSGVDGKNRQILMNEVDKRQETAAVFLVSHEQFDKKIKCKEVQINDKKIQFQQ
jgi:ABC-type multidrug transport system ATPase subunit